MIAMSMILVAGFYLLLFVPLTSASSRMSRQKGLVGDLAGAVTQTAEVVKDGLCRLLWGLGGGLEGAQAPERPCSSAARVECRVASSWSAKW